MSCNCIVKVLIENNVAAAVRPASYVYCYTNGRWMSCSIFNMYAHNRVLSAHSLRSKADLIDAVFYSFSMLAALSFSLWLPKGRIRAFLERRAAVSTEVATPTPTNSGGHAFKP